MGIDVTEAPLDKEILSPQLFIAGSWRDGSSRDSRELVDPATGRSFGVSAIADRQDVQDAVAAARESFDKRVWRRTPPKRRASMLLEVARRVAQRAEEYARAESLNNGMPVLQARGMVDRCISYMEYMAGVGQRALGESIPISGRFVNMTLREPIGVCALIIPWNGPLISAIWKLFPAISLGNSVVLKTSELTPVTAMMLARECKEVGIPDGVVNVIVGGGRVGHEMISDPRVDKIALTGSTATGVKVLQAAAPNISRVTLELGGKSPNVFFSDYGVEEAAAAASSALFLNCGQVCVAGTRILVERSMYPEFCEAFVERASGLRIGPGLDPSTQLGPLISGAHLERVMGYVDIGVEEGAELLYGGDRVTTGDLADGNFIEPTVFTTEESALRISREEVFGPVGLVTPFDDEDHAAELANDTEYGLAAGVWTRDGARALRLARRIRAGTVWVNTYGYNFPESPLGGFKKSGIGRENGTAAIEMYTELKNVVIDTSDRGLDIFQG